MTKYDVKNLFNIFEEKWINDLRIILEMNSWSKDGKSTVKWYENWADCRTMDVCLFLLFNIYADRIFIVSLGRVAMNVIICWLRFWKITFKVCNVIFLFVFSRDFRNEQYFQVIGNRNNIDNQEYAWTGLKVSCR